nr:mitosis inducer protein kinase cdr1-like [Danio rerio]XP_021322756.1 mitosis inducer protein kinase cdr1-like [Danio rerio]|eukprot:XP_021322734.1 mitosis inducer protein kinase cdr1-like [Danio rerio]
MKLKKPPLCPHITELYEFAMEGSKNYLVMEYVPSYITLGKFIRKNNGRLSESVARPLLMQLIIAAQRCIEHAVYHGSMHLENILVNPKTLQLKLIDFGNSTHIPDNCWRSPYLGVTRYRLQEGERYRIITHAVRRHVLAVRGALSRMVNGYTSISNYRRRRFHPSLSAGEKTTLHTVQLTGAARPLIFTQSP